MTNFSFIKRTRDQFRDWKSLSRERISREKNKCSFILKIQRDILFICLFWKSQTNQIAKFIFAGYSWNHWTSLWQQSIAKITITILKSVLKSGLLDTSSKSRCDKMIDGAFFFLNQSHINSFHTLEPFHIRRVSQNGTAYENSPYDAFFLKSHHNDVFVFHLPILSLTLIARVKRTRRASESDHPYPLPFAFVREVSSKNHLSFHRYKKAYIKFSRRGVRRFHRGGIRWDAVFKFLKVRP